MLYREYQSVCSFVRIGSPRPLSRKRVCLPPPLGTKREQHSFAGEGAEGEPIWTTGEKAWHSVYTLWYGDELPHQKSQNNIDNILEEEEQKWQS